MRLTPGGIQEVETADRCFAKRKQAQEDGLTERGRENRVFVRRFCGQFHTSDKCEHSPTIYEKA
jgi:hypothetical protein